MWETVGGTCQAVLEFEGDPTSECFKQVLEAGLEIAFRQSIL